jgi:hypothetical protein
MAIKRVFNGATIVNPGVFTKLVVENLTGFPLQAAGVIGIVGEAPGGEPRVLDILQREQIQDAKARYKSGPIADALELLVNPSNDPRIANGASTIVVYKANNSTQSSSILKNGAAAPADLLTLTSKNWGEDENNISVSVAAGSVADADAVIVGTIDESFTLAGGETLVLNVNGTVYTYTETLGAGAHTAAALAANMDAGGNWAPSKPVIAAVDVTTPTRIAVTLDPSVVVGGEKDYGYIVVDTATSTIDTVIGMSGSNRGLKGSRILTVTKGTAEEITPDLGGVNSMSVLYTGAGTSCLMDIQEVAGELKLTSLCAGAAADNLDLVLVDSEDKNKFTVKELVDRINAQGNYTAAVLDPNPDRNARELDRYDDILLDDVAALLRSDMQEVIDHLNPLSELVDAARVDDEPRELATFATPVFLAGATDGTSLNSDWVNGFAAFEDERINIVVPLISKDKGSLTIDSINASAKSHVISQSSTLGKSERNAYISKNASKDDVKSASQTSNQGLVSILGQQVFVQDRAGDLVWQDPWATACIVAGLQAGSDVGEPATKKLVNINNVRVEDSSWSAKQDLTEMNLAGVTVIEPIDGGGFRVNLHNTTNQDQSFVFNRVHTLEAANFVAFDLRFNLEAVFIGTKARTGSAEAIANFIRSRMTVYLNADIIVGDDLNDLLGYKNLRVSQQGNTAIVNVSITPVQGIDFILPTIYLADIQQSA